MGTKQYCPKCGQVANILIKPYKSKGRFPNRTGSCCEKCFELLKKDCKGKGITKELFLNWLKKE